MNMESFDKFAGCIIGGAIGDAYGGQFEFVEKLPPSDKLFLWGEQEEERRYFLSDDTQLTLATLEAILESGKIDPESIANKFVSHFEAGKLSGLGSASLQAIQGIRNGGHWYLVGKKGEQAAGNGSAMRIAPLAFAMKELDRQLIRDVSRISHHHEEAYVGCLAVVLSIQSILRNSTRAADNFLQEIALQLPDSLIRDRLLLYAKLIAEETISSIAATYGSSGYVVESVPLALFAFVKSLKIGFEASMLELIDAGGDTDTNASIMGQIAGTALGFRNLAPQMLAQIQSLDGYAEIQSIISAWKESMQN